MPSPFFNAGAGNEARTRDLNLGKVALYQLSYSRLGRQHFSDFGLCVKAETTHLALAHARPSGLQVVSH